MSEKDKVIAPAPESKKPEEGKPTEEKTIGDVLKTDNPPADPEKDKEEKEKKDNLIPESAFLKEKKRRKELEKEVEKLKEAIESGELDDDDTADTIESLAEEFGVEKKLLTKLAKTIKSDVEKDAEAKLSEKIKPLEEDKRQEKIDKAFKAGFEQAIEKMPEFAEIADPEVIKTLSLDPKNANKTFSQLIEATYSKSLGGKRTIEPTKPRGGKEPEEIDYDRARRDGNYFKEIMSDPDKKKEYNKNLETRLASQL